MRDFAVKNAEFSSGEKNKRKTDISNISLWPTWKDRMNAKQAIFIQTSSLGKKINPFSSLRPTYIADEQRKAQER